jgi:hypothetical protein
VCVFGACCGGQYNFAQVIASLLRRFGEDFAAAQHKTVFLRLMGGAELVFVVVVVVLGCSCLY